MRARASWCWGWDKRQVKNVKCHQPIRWSLCDYWPIRGQLSWQWQLWEKCYTMSGLRMSEWWGLVTNWLNKEGLQMTLCPLTVITRVFSVSCLQCLSAPREAETMWDMRLKTCEVTLLYGFSLFVLINTSALFHPSLYIRPSIAIVVRLWQRMNVWSFIFHTYFIKVHAFDVIRVIMSMPKNILILPGYRTVIICEIEHGYLWSKCVLV